VSLYMVILILATQQREYHLSQLREQLILELAILSEQQLLEESRRDNPLIRNRVNQEAEAMAQPAPTRNRCSTRSRRFTTRRSRSAAAQTAPRRRVVASFTPTVHPSGHPSQPETTIPLFAHCEFRSTRSMMVGVV
jgi:hypothetical protein